MQRWSALYAIVTGSKHPGYAILLPVEDGYVAQGYDHVGQPHPDAVSRHDSVDDATRALEERYGEGFHGWWPVPPEVDDPVTYALGHHGAAVAQRGKYGPPEA